MEKKSIITDVFQYDVTFRAYKETVNESESGWKLNHTFLKSLQDQGLFNRHNPTYLIGDIGCGEGDAIVTYLQDIDFKAGLDIRAMDNNSDFIGDSTLDHDNHSHRMSPAEKNFSEAKQSQIIPLKNYRLLYGDLKESDIPQVMCKGDEIQQSINPYDLVYLSHTMYYIRQQHKSGRYGITYVLDSITTHLLSNNGIAILLHVCLRPDSYTAVGYFTRSMTQDLIPTEEEYQKHSVDALVRSSCNELGVICYDIPYSCGLHFSENLKKYREVFKDPSRYDELLDNHDALQDFYRILFVAHRSVDDLYADKSARGLNHLVDNVINLVEKHGCVKLNCCMQVILGRQASKELKEKVKVAVHACQNQLHS